MKSVIQFINNIQEEIDAKKEMEEFCLKNPEYFFAEQLCSRCGHHRLLIGQKGKDYSNYVCGLCRFIECKLSKRELINHKRIIIFK